ncbi:MAG: ATP-dependent sacrificial sulfur transferase LarE [Proteocatella sp.]
MKNNIERLNNYFKDLKSENICIAFSGGVDSSLVLKTAVLAKKNVYAVMFNTRLHPCREEEEARDIARQIGVEITVMNIDEFSNPNILSNPIDRCYICKKMLFTELIDFAKGKSCDVILDGTNFDDYGQYRPGIKALNELGIKSPLAELKMTKAEVRKAAKELGLEVHNKPSAPCMATRFPYDTNITMEALEKVEEAEAFIKSLGIIQCRVRVHGDIARLEVEENDFISILKEKQSIISKLKALGYIYITLDIEGFRSGSMDVLIDTDSK